MVSNVFTAIELLASTSWACARCLTQEVQVSLETGCQFVTFPPKRCYLNELICPEQGCRGGEGRCWTHPWPTCVERRTWPAGGPEETASSRSTNGSWRKWSSCMRWVIKNQCCMIGFNSRCRVSSFYWPVPDSSHVAHPGGEDPSPAPAKGEARWRRPWGTSSHQQVPERAAVPQHELRQPVHLHLHLLADLQHHLRKRHHAQREQRLRLGRHWESGGPGEGAGHQGECGDTDWIFLGTALTMWLMAHFNIIITCAYQYIHGAREWQSFLFLLHLKMQIIFSAPDSFNYILFSSASVARRLFDAGSFPFSRLVARWRRRV